MISTANLKTSGKALKSVIGVRVWPQSAIFMAFTVMLIVSWRRWTSPIADSGREMDLPLRLLRGELLYRDVHYLYPPFSPYFNAQLYRIFGVHLDVLHASGAAGSALIVILCYFIARRLLSSSEAAIASTAVVLWSIFKPTGNLLSPYAFAALHGVILTLGVLLMTIRYAENRRKRELIGAGVLIGVAAITKQEFALTGAITVVAALIYLHRAKIKRLMSDLLFAAIPAAVIAAPVFGLLFYLVGWRTLVEDCHLFYTHLPASLVFYNKHRTGLDRPLLSILQMLGGAGVGAAAISGIVLLSDRTRRTLKRAGFVLVVSLLFAFAVRLLVGRQWDGGPLRALPLLLVAFLIIEWRRGRSGGEAKPESAALFIIAAYSLAILARVSLRVPSGGAFGGYFLPTSLVLFCYLFLRALPEALWQWTNDQLSARRARLIGQGMLLVLLVATTVIFGVRYRKTYNYEIKAQRGHLFAPGSSGPVISSALDLIEKETRPGEAIAVLPEGSDLAFLTGRRMPLRHQILIPGLMSEKDEAEAIVQLQEQRVRFVLIVNRPMREFGAEAFGRDFYPTLGGWIDEHYRLVEVIGAGRGENPQIGAPDYFIKVFIKAP
jgi:4-amino-4-deoxy-L-arabinose transferase-like glycosyltransferase